MHQSTAQHTVRDYEANRPNGWMMIKIGSHIDFSAVLLLAQDRCYLFIGIFFILNLLKVDNTYACTSLSCFVGIIGICAYKI